MIHPPAEEAEEREGKEYLYYDRPKPPSPLPIMYLLSPEQRRYSEIDDLATEDTFLIPKRTVMASTAGAINIERRISHGIGGAGNVRMCL